MSFEQEVWPMVWKLETVSVIPKVSDPSGLGETRNISCTPVFAKIMGYFLLERLKKESTIGDTQFGGRPGPELPTTLLTR